MNGDRTEEAARRAEARDHAGRADPEPSLARRFSQIGVLGWMIVIPILVGLFAGRWLDHWLGTALLHKSGDDRGSPFPGRTYPTASVTVMPRAV